MGDQQGDARDAAGDHAGALEQVEPHGDKHDAEHHAVDIVLEGNKFLSTAAGCMVIHLPYDSLDTNVMVASDARTTRPRPGDGGGAFTLLALPPALGPCP